MSALRQNTPDVLDRKVTKKGMAEKHTVGEKKTKKVNCTASDLQSLQSRKSQRD